MTTVYIIRHAEADGNIYRRIHGQYDGWITENGYAQIERLKELFKDRKVDAVYSSDLFRAIKTVEPIADARKLQVLERPELREINLGVWEDETWGEIALKDPETLYNFNNRPWLWYVDKAETPSDVMDRMTRIFSDIVRENEGKNIVICSHGMAIRFLMCSLLCKHIEQICEIGHCDNTGISLIEIENGKTNVIYVNDNSHLGELSTLARQKWWKKKSDIADGNARFAPVDFEEQSDILKSFLHKKRSFLLHLDNKDENELFMEAKLRAESDKRSVVFAYSGDKIIGVIALDMDNNTNPDAGRLDYLLLDEAYDSIGYGVQLMGYAVSIYRNIHKKFMELEVSGDNNKAVDFFTRHAFKEISKRQGKYGEVWLLRKIIDYYRS